MPTPWKSIIIVRVILSNFKLTYVIFPNCYLSHLSSVLICLSHDVGHCYFFANFYKITFKLKHDEAVVIKAFYKFINYFINCVVWEIVTMSDRNPGPVPSRWLKCPRKATGLFADQFLAFKTPLDSRYNDQVQDIYRFTPTMLFDSVKSFKVCQHCSNILNQFFRCCCWRVWILF